jgi:hypothetical protein
VKSRFFDDIPPGCWQKKSYVSWLTSKLRSSTPVFDAFYFPSLGGQSSRVAFFKILLPSGKPT